MNELWNEPGVPAEIEGDSDYVFDGYTRRDSAGAMTRAEISAYGNAYWQRVWDEKHGG
jgi:hypothetical protein